MVDDLNEGRRPFVARKPTLTDAHRDAMAACPGRALEHDYDGSHPDLIHELEECWGPVLRMWEGHAADPEIRFAGSSGGAATGLALFAIERAGMYGALHIAARDDAPILNHTVLSRTREELLKRTGSRYAPASPCDRLDLIDAAPHPCVFIGKPCDVAAVHRTGLLREGLKAKVGLTIAVFCAGTPSIQGTMEALAALGINDPAAVRSIRYRGNGWPGVLSVDYDSENGPVTKTMTYDKSWGQILQKHRQWRCYVCPDHTGEFADVAVGDPWHTPPDGENPGRSLIVARTPRGRELVEAAISAGYLVATPAPSQALPDSQPHLRKVRGNVWARSLVCRLLGVPAPKLRRVRTFSVWLHDLTMRGKFQSVLGTARRVFRKRLRHRISVTPMEAPVRHNLSKPERTHTEQRIWPHESTHG